MPPTDEAPRSPFTHRLAQRVKTHLSPELIALLRELRRLQGPHRRRFAWLRLRRAARRRLDLSTLPPEPRVLFVCYGNKLRSPMAEALLRHAVAAHALHGVRVVSSGTHAEPGLRVSADALAAASRHGVSLAAHEARTISAALLDDADVVFVMDRGNEAELLTRYADAERRVVMLGAFAPDRRDGAIIPDPDNGTAADLARCYARLDACIAAVARELTSAGARSPRWPAGASPARTARSGSDSPGALP